MLGLRLIHVSSRAPGLYMAIYHVSMITVPWGNGVECHAILYVKDPCTNVDILWHLQRWKFIRLLIKKNETPWHVHLCSYFLMASWNGNRVRVTGPVTGGFPSQRPVTRGFDVFFDVRMNKRLRKQSKRRWFETPERSLWRQRNVVSIVCNVIMDAKQNLKMYGARCNYLILFCNWISLMVSVAVQ